MHHYEVEFRPQLDSKRNRAVCLKDIQNDLGINTKSFDGGTKLLVPQRLERDDIVAKTDILAEKFGKFQNL